MDWGYVLRLFLNRILAYFITSKSEIVMIRLEHIDRSSAILQPVVDVPDLLLS